MEYIQFILAVLTIVFIDIVIIGIFMRLANYIGGLFGFGKLFKFLLRKIKRE